ncbi:MAG: hypothetical protein CMJ67_02510 [Planctomycetaceae bacterium]|nr:hypothetical protein [Planctomycetaceae bacterium]
MDPEPNILSSALTPLPSSGPIVATNPIKSEFACSEDQTSSSVEGYLDSAATTPVPNVIADEVARVLREGFGNPGRGGHTRAISAAARIEEARRAVAGLLGNVDFNEVVFTRNATAGIDLVRRCWAEPMLGAGSAIVTTRLEHHSNILPWMQIAERSEVELRIAGIDSRGDLDLDHLRKLLVEGGVGLVAVTAVSNVHGGTVDLEAVVSLAAEHGARVLVDASQCMAHRPLLPRKLGCDFLVFSGHKMYAPPGVGVLWASSQAMQEMRSGPVGGGSVDWNDEEPSWREGPELFEPGTPSSDSIAGLAAAIEWRRRMSEVDPGLQDREHSLLRRAEAIVEETPELSIAGTPSRRTGCLAFSTGTIDPNEFAAFLDAEGIMVRAGHLCASPLVRTFDPRGLVRISIGCFNDEKDLDRFEDAVQVACSILA